MRALTIAEETAATEAAIAFRRGVLASLPESHAREFLEDASFLEDVKYTERFWRAPDGQNLLMDIAIDDPEIYGKPFLLNRQEWLAAGPDFALSEDKCEPSSIWERRMRAKAAEAGR